MLARLRSLETYEKLYIVAWCCYLANYPGRFAYGAALVAIGQAEGYSPTQLGLVSSVLFASYAIFQLVGGRLGDRFDPVKLVTAGFAGSAACNIMMALSGGIGMMAAAQFINGAFCCIIWAPLVRQITLIMPNDRVGGAMLGMQYCGSVGMCVTFLLVSLLTAVFPWRVTFFVTAAALAAAALTWNLSMSRARGAYTPQEHPRVMPSQNAEGTRGRELYVKSGFVFILLVVLIMGFVKDGIQTWVPKSITDVFGAPAWLSVFMSAGLPLVTMLGPMAVKAFRKKRPDDDLLCAALFFGGSAVLLAVICAVSDLSALLNLVLFSLASACVTAVCTAFIFLAPVKYAPYGRSATVAAVTNSVYYMGAAGGGVGLGAAAERISWGWICLALAALCIAGALMAVCLRKPWNAFSRRARALYESRDGKGGADGEKA